MSGSAIEMHGVNGNGIAEVACPICRYSLEGLPQRHRCPECGYYYTKPFAVFRRSVANWQWLALANLATFVAGIVLVLAEGKFTFLLLTGIGFIAATLRGFAVLRKVIVTPEVVQIVIGSRIKRRVPIESIGECLWSSIDGSVRLLDCAGMEIGVIPRGFLWSHRKSKKLVDAINAIVDRRHVKGKSG